MDRMKGCFYGCAVGDALGTPLEFHDRDTLPVVTEMIVAEHWKLPAGSWTDDTSLMLCLSASIAARGGLGCVFRIIPLYGMVRKRIFGCERRSV